MNRMARQPPNHLALDFGGRSAVEAELVEGVHQEVVLAAIERAVAPRHRVEEPVECRARLRREVAFEEQRVDLEIALQLDRDALFLRRRIRDAERSAQDLAEKLIFSR